MILPMHETSNMSISSCKWSDRECMVLTPDALVLVQDSLGPSVPQRRSCSKN